MELLGLIGSLAFSLASAAVGIRLLALARTTRCAPELSMGIALTSSGGVGFVLYVAGDLLRRNGADAALVARVVQLGMLFFFIGYLGLAVGNWRIFRPSSRRPIPAVAAIGALLVGICAVMFGGAEMEPGMPGEIASWLGVATGSGVFAWAGVECRLLFVRMRKRARIGLVEASVVDRVRLWGVGAFAAFLMSGHALVLRIATGTNQMAESQRLLSSLLGLVAAFALWLAFFPPPSYRRRFVSPASA